MSKAEEFYKTYKPKINTLETKDHKAFIDAIICDVAEAYHQSRIKDISDEDIINEFYPNLENIPNSLHGDYMIEYDNKEFGAKWFKNKLLKQ